MKRTIALLAILCLLLTACGNEREPYVPTGDGLIDGTGATAATTPEETQELKLAYYASAGFHPYECTNPTNRALFSLIYQGLFAVDAAYHVEPMLCKSYEMSADMRTYRFYLEEATFSDGQYVTAKNVVDSLLAAKEDGYYAGRFGHITKIEAAEDGSVVITLDTPCENLPVLLDIPIIKELEASEKAPLGTGPYILESTPTGKQLRRQPAWWCDAALNVRAAVIPLIAGESPSEIRDLFEFSQLGLVCTDPGSDNYVDFRGDYELWESENGLFLYIGFNAESKVFSVDAIRSTLTHAINRDALVIEFFRGFAHSTTLPASPLFPHYSQSLAARFGYAQQKFTQAVDEAQLEEKTVVFLVNKDDSRRMRTARAIKKMIEQSGLQVTMSELSGEEFRKALQKGEFDLYLAQTKLSPNMDLTAFFAEDGALNFGKMDTVAANAVNLEALANSGNYQSLHELVMEEGLICPILFRSDAIYGQRGLLSGLTPARDSIFYYSLGKDMKTALIQS